MKLFKPLLIASAVFVLASCNVTPNGEVLNNEPAIDLRAADNQYAFAAYTGVRMLEEISVSSAPQALRKADEVTDPDEELATVNRYLTLYKELTEEGVLNVTMAEVSDRLEYAFQITITTTDIDKSKSTFVLYFNEEVIVSEEEIEDDIDDSGEEVIEENTEDEVEDAEGKHYRDRDEERSEEESTLLVGLVVIGDEEFAVTGYRLVEETEVKLGFRARLDDGRVLRISHHSEENVQRFQYFLRNGKVLIAQKKVMIETEDNETKLKLEEVNDGVKERYSFKREVSEEGTYYKIRFVTPEGKGTIHIFVTVDDLGNEVLEYYFSGGSTYHHDGNGNHHGEHDDDDDGKGGKGGNGGNGGNGNHECPDQEDDEDYEEEFDDLGD